MSLIKAFIFDVDGTLLDSVALHIAAWVAAFKAHGYEFSHEEIHRLIGMGSDKMIPAITGLTADSPAVSAITEYKTALYEERYLPTVRPLPGVDQLFPELDRLGMRVAVASSATGEKLERLLRIARCEDHLPVESCTKGRSKPDPDKVLGAARWLELPPQRCVVVGDSPFDTQAAARAGARFVGFLSGGRTASELQPAIATFQDPGDMAENVAMLLHAAA